MMMNLEEARKILELSLADYSLIRAAFWSGIHDAIENFLRGQRNIKGFFNDMRIAVSEKYQDAGNQAWIDGGGTFPMNESTREYIQAAIQTEYGFIDQLANRYKLLKQEEDFDADLEINEAFERADGYAKSLDRLYANVKLRAAGRIMLTFVGEDGAESCKDCQKYKGKRHRASWWVSHNAIPPNRDFECKGYQCQHVLIDDDGKLYTV